MEVFYTARGGHIEESQIRTEQWELPRDTLGFDVSEHIEKLWANFRQNDRRHGGPGETRLNSEVNRRILSLLTEALPTGRDEYVPSTGPAKEVDAFTREVRDAIKPNGLR